MCSRIVDGFLHKTEERFVIRAKHPRLDQTHYLSKSGNSLTILKNVTIADNEEPYHKCRRYRNVERAQAWIDSHAMNITSGESFPFTKVHDVQPIEFSIKKVEILYNYLK